MITRHMNSSNESNASCYVTNNAHVGGDDHYGDGGSGTSNCDTYVPTKNEILWTSIY